MAYPKCNMIFKYDVDFREIGSSGNVFIYIRGTACVGQNPIMDNLIKENDKLKEQRLTEASKKEKEIEDLNKFQVLLLNTVDKIPKNLNEVESKLN